MIPPPSDSRTYDDAVLDSVTIPHDNQVKFKEMWFTISGYTSTAPIVLATNTDNKARNIAFITFSQSAFAASAGTILLSTSLNASTVPVSVAASGSGVTLPQRQCVQYSNTSSGFTFGYGIWQYNTPLTLTFSANPTGLVGKLRIVYFN